MKKDIFSLKGKVCIITGGNQGIGKVVAGYIADAGADVAIIDLNDATEVANAIAEEYGVRTCAYVCDVTKPADVKACIEAIAEKMGTIDLLFNNAGIVYHEDAETCPAEKWAKVVDVNLNGIYYVAQAFAKYLIDHNKTGNIVNTASMSATIVNVPQQQASYNASKAGVKHLTKSLAVEWAEHGIRVNCISPGYIQTEMTGAVSEEWRNSWLGTIPFRRMGTPHELAGAVIYLLSDAATYTSGCDLIIDGCFTNV